METKARTKIIFGLPSLAVGGIERQLIKQLEIFDREKFEIFLITLFEYKNIPNLYEKVPEDIKVFKMGLKGKFDVVGFVRLYKILKNISPDVVVTSMFSANTIFRVFQVFFCYKSFAREHNIYLEKNWIQKLTDKVLSTRSEKIIAVSRTVAEFAAKQAGISSDKFIVIHNGVEISEIEKYKNGFSKSDLRQKLNIKRDDVVFLNVGRLTKQKQQALLIESFKKVVDYNNNAKLYIVGRGGETDNLKSRISELNLTDNVVLVGYSDSVHDYYRAADAFVLSSKYEGFPNVAIEAMAFGLALISTKVPGVDEFLVDGKNGFLMEENPKSISDSILRFLNLSEFEKNTISADAEKTSKEFDINRTVDKYTALYLK
jgi:glycosyltransferase involved in cell wall biosynthesis